ncbi:hypothetical protein GCQ56_05485 [Marinifilum sp. N1E240]|uniref:EpsG family protein n=1 Tax=Marinifilum sp. N1E240 TaxID=2608082 RepID=UPI00128DEB45|nr:EpsG family protein [Marinifilum sp. N1E240]MPQ46456.1 hypothetical protein [Marinifilum sp. N1E240]
MVYLVVLCVLLLFTFKFDVSKQVRGRKFSIYFASFLLIILSGFRYRIGLDTMQYMKYYEYIPTFDILTYQDIIFSPHAPLYFIIEVFAKTISPDFFVLQIIHAVFVNLIIVNFFKKHTKYVFTAILLYYLTLYVSFNFEVMRASMAIAIFLGSYDYLRQKKWIMYYIFCVLAIMMHVSAIILLIIPFLTKLKMTKYGIFYLFIAIILSIIIGENIKFIFEKIAVSKSLIRKSELYLNSQYSGQVLNIFGVITTVISNVLLPYLAVVRLKKIKNKRLDYEFLIILCILMSIFSINVQIFVRYIQFFFPFLLLAFTDLIGLTIYTRYSNKSINLKVTFIMVLFLVLKLKGQYFADISGISNYNRYLPYSSILTKEESILREKMFDSQYLY